MKFSFFVFVFLSFLFPKKRISLPAYKYNACTTLPLSALWLRNHLQLNLGTVRFPSCSGPEGNTSTLARCTKYPLKNGRDAPKGARRRLDAGRQATERATAQLGEPAVHPAGRGLVQNGIRRARHGYTESACKDRRGGLEGPRRDVQGRERGTSPSIVRRAPAFGTRGRRATVFREKYAPGLLVLYRCDPDVNRQLHRQVPGANENSCCALGGRNLSHMTDNLFLRTSAVMRHLLCGCDVCI